MAYDVKLHGAQAYHLVGEVEVKWDNRVKRDLLFNADAQQVFFNGKLKYRSSYHFT